MTQGILLFVTFSETRESKVLLLADRTSLRSALSLFLSLEKQRKKGLNVLIIRLFATFLAKKVGENINALAHPHKTVNSLLSCH